MKLSIQIIRHLVVAFAAIAQGEICVAGTADTAHDLLLKHLDPVLAVPADVVEVVFSAGKFSHLEYVPKGVATVSRPALLQHQRLQQPEMQKFGFCKPDRKGALALTKRPCGFVLPLEKTSSPVDLLNFEKMVIKGKFEGSWKIALADAHLAAKEENVVIGEVADAVGAGVSLETAARTIDLRKSSQLVFILASPKGSLQVDEIELLPASPRPARPEIRSMWLWDSRVPLARPKEVADDLRRRGVGRIYLQVADDPEPLAPFLAQANKRGIEVWALDGSPDYAEHPGPLLARVQAVKEFNSRHAGTPFKGFQIDVEPHLKRDFRLRLDFYAGKYVALVRELKEIKGAGLPLSVVIPFWYDSLKFEDRSLTWHLFRWTDEAAIMSYRTSLPEIEDIAREELAYGERMNIPVFLGLETTAIPDEEHIVFRRCGAIDLTSSASSASWCRQSGYSVPGGKISFSGKPDAFFATLNRRPAGSSFGGWIIHSYESAPR